MTRRQKRYAANPEAERARNREQYRKHRTKRLAAAKARHAENRERDNARCRAYHARTYKPKSSRRSPRLNRAIRLTDDMLVRNHAYRERAFQTLAPELRELVEEQRADDTRRMISKPWERSLFEPIGDGGELIDMIAA